MNYFAKFYTQSWVGTPLMDIYICMLFLDYAYKFRYLLQINIEIFRKVSFISFF